MLGKEERKKITKRVGPMGDLLVDLAGRLQYPIDHPMALARQFSEEQKIVLGVDQYPVPQLALMLPEDFFPLESFDDLVAKLEESGLKEVQPASLADLLAAQPGVGYRIRREEETLRRGAEKHAHSMGGPGDPVEPMKRFPILADSDPDRSRMVEELGPMGDMLLDILDKVHFPIENPPELARQFEEDEVLVLGINEIPLARVALMMPSELFPINSHKAFVKKLLAANIREVTPAALHDFLGQPDTIALLFEADEEDLRKRAEQYPMEFGGPGTLPKPSRQPPVVQDTWPERTKAVDRLGPIGEIVYDLAAQIPFPVKDPMTLSNAFKEKDCLMIGLRQYPLRMLALQTPSSLFPIASLDELVEKLEKEKVQEISLDQLARYVVESNTEIGFSIPYPEKVLRKMAETEKMEFGGPERLPEDNQ